MNKLPSYKYNVGDIVKYGDYGATFKKYEEQKKYIGKCDFCQQNRITLNNYLRKARLYEVA